MNCITCQDNITSEIDNEIDEKTKDETASHIKECTKCRELYLNEYTTKMLVREKCKKEMPPDDLKDKITNDIRSGYSEKTLFSFKKKIQPYIVYAAAAVLILSIISLFKMSPWQDKEVTLAKMLLPENAVFVSKSENIISIEGTIVCICCEMKKKGAHSECRKYGHTYGVRTDNGVLWTIMKNNEGMKVIDHKKLVGKRVKISGQFLLNGNYIDIREYDLAQYTSADSEYYSLVK